MGVPPMSLCRTSRNGAFNDCGSIRIYCIGVRGQGATGALMKSLVAKRSIVIDGHKTSVSLEDAFWRDLKNIAHTQQASLGELVARIDQTRDRGNLSSAIRLFVLEYFQKNGSS